MFNGVHIPVIDSSEMVMMGHSISPVAHDEQFPPTHLSDGSPNTPGSGVADLSRSPSPLYLAPPFVPADNSNFNNWMHQGAYIIDAHVPQIPVFTDQKRASFNFPTPEPKRPEKDMSKGSTSTPILEENKLTKKDTRQLKKETNRPMPKATPTNKHNQRNNHRRDNSYKAEIVEHITLKSREVFDAGKLLHKKWLMKNIGRKAWDRVMLVCIKDVANINMAPSYPVSFCSQGKTVQVEAAVKVPEKPGRYCAYYRLQIDEKKFGPRIWVDICSQYNPRERN